MPQTPVDHSPDLKQLRGQGYDIQIVQGVYLFVFSIPYLNENKEVKQDGVLITKLELAASVTVNPVKDHVAYFVGEKPCDENGMPFTHIINDSTHDLSPGVPVNFVISSKPETIFEYYPDYFHKMRHYINMLLSAAQAHDPDVSAAPNAIRLPAEEDSVFEYADTNSSRAEINFINAKLKGQKIGIIGLGGTGSYVMDLLTKTPVAEIHLFDGDVFLNHNAFRAPGAPSFDSLRLQWKKTEYFKAIYSKMRKHITSHPHYITSQNLYELQGLSFVFICMDVGPEKKDIVEWLLQNNIRFIDVGMGLQKKEEQLSGQVRTTLGTSQTREEIKARIGYKEDIQNEYVKNIQIADLNALNASLAVIKWKKLFGFYSDLKNHFNSLYIVSTNKIINDASET